MPATVVTLLARQSEASMTAQSQDSVGGLNATPTQFVPILVVGILIIVAVAGLFGYRAWKGRQMISENYASRQERKLDDWYNGSDETSSIEKPKKATLAGDVEAYAGWVPQIRTWRGIHVEGIQLPSESNAGLAKSRSIEKKEFPLPEQQPSPPPTYVASNESPKHVPSPLPGIPAMPVPLEDSDVPVVSPRRTASMQPPVPVNPFAEKESAKETVNDSLPLPRVMIVQNTFKPNLEDELPIVRGEAIRMLAEYKDGWCVVQRIGSYDSPKGVVPRSCLQERREARRA